MKMHKSMDIKHHFRVRLVTASQLPPPNFAEAISDSTNIPIELATDYELFRHHSMWTRDTAPIESIKEISPYLDKVGKDYVWPHTLISPWVERSEQVLEIKKVVSSFNKTAMGYKIGTSTIKMSMELSVNPYGIVYNQKIHRELEQTLTSVSKQQRIYIKESSNTQTLLINNLTFENWPTMRNFIGVNQEIFEYYEETKTILNINQLRSPFALELLQYNQVETSYKMRKIEIRL
jgi:hypothetical protein